MNAHAPAMLSNVRDPVKPRQGKSWSRFTCAPPSTKGVA
jgi:hypothetical protein